MAPVGQSELNCSPSDGCASHTVAGPRPAAAYGSGLAGQRVVSTPFRKPLSTHI
jgi:hypothetical protein